jgi:putative monooxygenase
VRLPLLALLPALLGAAGADPGKIVADQLNREKDALHRCWEQAAADDFRLAGTITLKVALDAKGKVKKASVAETSTSDPVLQACVLERARTWTFAGAGVDEIDVPLQFVAPDAQYTVRLEDAPLRTPAKGKLEARILLDLASVGATKASLMHFRLARNAAIPFHRHTGAEVVFVTEGSIEVLGLAGGKATRVNKGDALYVAAGVAHSIRSTAPKRTSAELVVLYAPPGPDKSYKDRSATPATSVVPPAELAKPDPAAPQPLVAKSDDVDSLPIAAGKGTVKILFDAATAKDKAAYVGWFEAQAGMTVPEHNHAKEAELLFVVAGAGEMKIAGEVIPIRAGMAVHVPVGVKHSFKATEPLQAVQFYSPSGPEQRFKAPAAAPAPVGKTKR